MTPAPGPAGGGAVASRRLGELKPRLISALVMAVLALGAAWIGGPLFGLFWLVAGLVVLWEWMRLVGAGRSAAILWSGIAALGVAAALCATGRPLAATGIVLAGAVAAAVAADPGRRSYAGGGVVYAGVLVAAVPLLRQSEPFGLAAILWLFAVVWGSDTMAFVGGRLIGGPKLAPRLSPSKTWSGFLVGAGSGALLGLLVAPRSDCPACILVLGLLGGFVAQGGDLFESSMKRRFGAKDAGAIIPGHGGLMDRLDGFIATSLAAAILGCCRFGPAAAGAGLFRW